MPLSLPSSTVERRTYMPRRNKKTRVITVEPYTDLIVNHVYEATIKDYTLHEASNRLRVTMENCDPLQEGRLHQVEMRLPVHPLDRTCRFLAACGIEATEIGTQIQIDLILGCHIGLRYRGQDGGTEAFDFDQIVPPPATETATPAAGNSETEPTESEDAAIPPADREAGPLPATGLPPARLHADLKPAQNQHDDRSAFVGLDDVVR
jgi:hypothetical protein